MVDRTRRCLANRGQEVVLEVLSQFTATVPNTEYHVATAWQNNGVSGYPEASDIQNAAADLTAFACSSRPCLRSKSMASPHEDVLPQSKECEIVR